LPDKTSRDDARRVRDKGVAAVVGHVQPLVSVGRPGVHLLHALHEMRIARARGDPHAERSVDVRPCAILPGDRDQRFEVIEAACVHITCLQYEYDRGGFAVESAQGRLECGRLERISIVLLKHLQTGVTKAEQPHSTVDDADASPEQAVWKSRKITAFNLRKRSAFSGFAEREITNAISEMPLLRQFAGASHRLDERIGLIA
jgi:hypothetical protein